ncbi:hypothetical protein [Hyphomicrobium sp.]|uniref:hypothetical protein n=1 Tax=Hyphomicrobium sp. TaxID=82 RepID=UPI000F904D99|nr:hypothetical protein [Hyphomicrobium sp.]RUP09043.1 MAG: hypothetical protein EKK38_10385 [Hyphomicrobium sp.]
MFGTTASKIVASVVLIASASGTVGLPTKPDHSSHQETPVALDSKSLLVATLENGEIQTQWMPRDVCEHVASAVHSGDLVAGVRADGVKVYISRANCSTRRVPVDASKTAFNAASKAD